MKRTLALFLALVMVLALAGCGGQSAGTAPAQTQTQSQAQTQSSGSEVESTKPAEVKNITIGHTFGETNMLHQGILRFKELIEEKSGGTITVTVHGNSALGSDAEMIQQVRLGSLDAQPISLPFVSGEYPQCGIDQLPFLFDSAEKAYAAYDGDLGAAIEEEVFTKLGITKIGNVMGQGFREFTNNVRPITTPDDMKNIKFRTTESKVRIAMFESCGASVITMPLSELFTSLQNGAVDGQENPLSTIDSNGFFEVQKYLSLSDHIFVANFMVMNTNKWNSFTAEEQAMIKECWNEAADYERGLLSDSTETFLNKFRDAGMQINEVDKEAFVKAVEPVWESYISEFGSEWIDMARNAS